VESDLVQFRILVDVPYTPLLQDLRRVEREAPRSSNATLHVEISVADLAASTIDVTTFTRSRCAALARSKSGSATPNASRSRSSLQ
jgi:hypothetical protein